MPQPAQPPRRTLPLAAAPKERSTENKLFGGFLLAVIGVGVALHFTNR